MENSLYITLSRQGVLRRQMDITANNIANMNTTGYKAQHPVFSEYLVRNRDDRGSLGDTLAFVRDVATVRDTSEGPMQQTGNPLDVAIQGDGYFVVESPNGPLYTRNGRFRIDETGQLVTEHGHPVMADAGAAIVFDGSETDIGIGRDGTVSTRFGDLGRLRIVRFDNPQELQAVAGGLMTTGAVPEDMESPNIQQGMLEGSNVEGVVEMTRMIEVQRAYESARKLIDSEDERIKKMIQEYAR